MCATARSELSRVSCDTVNDCHAVGKNGVALNWDDSSWSDFSTAALGGTELQSVSATGGGCRSGGPLDGGRQQLTEELKYIELHFQIESSTFSLPICLRKQRTKLAY